VTISAKAVRPALRTLSAELNNRGMLTCHAGGGTFPWYSLNHEAAHMGIAPIHSGAEKLYSTVNTGAIAKCCPRLTVRPNAGKTMTCLVGCSRRCADGHGLGARWFASRAAAVGPARPAREPLEMIYVDAGACRRA
jgi:hypothetical protein